jgi:hypothetical protein
MTLKNDHELANTRNKLHELEEIIRLAKQSAAPGHMAEVRSLAQLANQLREEIIRYETADASRRVG